MPQRIVTYALTSLRNGDHDEDEDEDNDEWMMTTMMVVVVVVLEAGVGLRQAEDWYVPTTAPPRRATVMMAMGVVLCGVGGDDDTKAEQVCASHLSGRCTHACHS